MAAAGDTDFAISDAELVGPGSVQLQGVERASLTGGVAANTFTVDGWKLYRLTGEPLAKLNKPA